MATRAEQDGLAERVDGAEPGYDAWKRVKIERGLEQSRDRDCMVPIDQLWRDLTLER